MPITRLPLALAAIFVVCLTAFAENAAPFIRKATLTNGTVQLETCIRHYRPESGSSPDIYLAGVIHVGSSNYYAAVQKHLDAQKLVLFEGVGRADKKKPTKSSANPTNTPNSSANKLSSLQDDMAKMLGCIYQMDGIDYERAHFRNSDLSIEQINERLKGKPIDGDRFMQMAGFSGIILKPLMSFLSATPESRAMIKLMFVEILSEAANDMDSMTDTLPGMQDLFNVILHDRNDAVFADLKTELTRTNPPASISLFYGAAHMTGLAERIEKELHYRPADEQWLPAFGVNPKKEKISPDTMNLIRSMIQMIKEAKARKPVEKPKAAQ